MDLQATDVENREFPEARKGYQREDVDRFLDEVAGQFRHYEERLAAMAQRVAQLDAELGQSRQTEEMSRRMLLVAQRASEEAVAEAEEKARVLVADAQGRAATLDDEVKRRRSTLEGDIEALRNFEAEYRKQLKLLLDAHMQMFAKTGRASVEPPMARTPQPAPSDQSRAAPSRTVAESGTEAGGPPRPIRVADNEVLRRLAEQGRGDA